MPYSWNEDASTPGEGDAIRAVSVAPYLGQSMTREADTAPGSATRLFDSVPYSDLPGVYSYEDDDNAAHIVASAPSGSSLYPQVGATAV